MTARWNFDKRLNHPTYSQLRDNARTSKFQMYNPPLPFKRPYYNPCINCGRTGHSARDCFEPITSFGIIAIRKNGPKIKKGLILPETTWRCQEHALLREEVEEVENIKKKNLQSKPDNLQENREEDNREESREDNQVLYLLIKRKDSMGNVDVIRQKFGKWEEVPEKHKEMLLVQLGEMTCQERKRLREMSFQDLWSDLWVNHNNKSFLHEYMEAKRRFERFNFGDLLDQVPCKFVEQEYGFPKGRKKRGESDKDCALREFQEESGYEVGDIRVLNERPIEELFVGTNGVKYRHIYYVAEVLPRVGLPKLDVVKMQQGGEISNVGWFTYEQAHELFREYDVEKKRILTDLHEKYKSRYKPKRQSERL